MSWEAYDNIIVCYDMIIKCKMSENLLEKSETVVLFYEQIVSLEYISFAMNVLLEYFNIDLRNFYIGIVIKLYRYNRLIDISWQHYMITGN